MTHLSAQDIRKAAEALLVLLETIKPQRAEDHSVAYDDAVMHAKRAAEILEDNAEDLHDSLTAALKWTEDYAVGETKPLPF